MGHIRIRHVGKAYKRYARKWGRLAEWVGAGTRHELKWVLRDLTFDVSPGEAVGIIGFNGAGKSTLLKIVSGTTRATTGNVEAGGRIAALLELGIGFHPDFTGRENVHMAGQLRGLGSADMHSLMPDIEAFAEIGDYIDQPLRVYSSGMAVRLAFSVATAVRPEILIVDEALAVGDILFQQKCFDRIRAYCDAGTTLLFVSHSMSAVYSLCHRALLLHEGRIAIDGRPKDVIDLYNALALRAQSIASPSLVIAGAPADERPESVRPESAAQASPHLERENASTPAASSSSSDAAGSYKSRGASIIEVQLLHEGRAVEAFVSESWVEIRIRTRFDLAFDDPHVGFQIRDNRGEPVFMTNTHCMARPIGAVAPGDEVIVAFRFRASLAAGDYSVTAGAANGGLPEGLLREPLFRIHRVRTFTVLRNFDSILWSGVYNLAPTCSIERPPVSGRAEQTDVDDPGRVESGFDRRPH